MYSVWDHAKRHYDYYRTPEESHSVNAPKPKHLTSTSLGLAPEQAAWPLPSKARHVGKGKYPKGQIASHKRFDLSGLGLIPDLTPTNILLMGALGFMVWKYVLKQRR